MYLTEAAWKAMSKSERKKTDDKKKRESRKGKQFVKNTKTARKARKMASKRAARSMQSVNLEKELKLLLQLVLINYLQMQIYFFAT